LKYLKFVLIYFIPLAIYSGEWSLLPDLPEPMSNNAVTAVNGRLYSFLGLNAAKVGPLPLHAFTYHLEERVWTRLPDVPAGKYGGRLAATAQAVGDKIYLIGGYALYDKGEVSVKNVDIYDTKKKVWEVGSPMPIPTDDAVSGVWKNRYILIISGWSQTKNLKLVQFYDTKENIWIKGSPITGPAVFGHSGSILGNIIVYCDGVTNFVWTKNTNKCFIGKLDKKNIGHIDWKKIPPHPGKPRYRMAAGASHALNAIVFSGGTTNPYNIDGIGYDGKPSTAEAQVFYYSLNDSSWATLGKHPSPTMDHRNLLIDNNSFYIIGGMDSQQKVLRQVSTMQF